MINITKIYFNIYNFNYKIEVIPNLLLYLFFYYVFYFDMIFKKYIYLLGAQDLCGSVRAPLVAVCGLI